MKFLKRLTIVMYFGWTILLVLILTFGTQIAGMISAHVSKEIHEEKNKLDDVVISTSNYLIERTYPISFTVLPDTHPIENIVFTSLTPDVFEVVNDTQIKGKRLSNDINIGKLLITSKTEPTFRKEVELTFIKTYPTGFDFYLSDSEHFKQSTNDVYIDTPFFINAILKSNQGGVTENQISFNYDSEYFTVLKNSHGELELKPKYQEYQIGDEFEPVTTTIELVVNGKIVDSKIITIHPILYAESFDKIMFSSYPSTHLDINSDVFVNQSFYLELYENNEKLRTPFEVSTDDSSLVNIGNDGELKFLKRGVVNITVTLKNGFSQTFKVKIRDRIVPPNVTSPMMNDNGEIVVKLEMSTTVSINFPGHASFKEYTYQLDSQVANEELNEENKISVIGRQIGTYNLVIYVNDGIEEPITVIYKIHVIPNENSLSEITQEFSHFLAKILGHMSFFIVQAILGILMISFYKSKNKWLNWLVILLVGLLAAWTSEFIQFFIPGRYCSIEDVALDMSGYFVGLLFGLIIRLFIRTIKQLHNKHQEVKL